MSDRELHPAMETGRTEIDVAALSAGVIAVAVSAMVSPGPYGGFGAILALTLLILIIAYSWAGRRNLPHSIAFAAVIALVGMQLAAFFLELRASSDPMRLIEGSEYGSAKAAVAIKAALQVCAVGDRVSGFTCPRTPFENAVLVQMLSIQDKSRVNGAYLLLAWILIFTFSLAIERGVLFAGSWWPNSQSARDVRLEATSTRSLDADASISQPADQV